MSTPSGSNSTNDGPRPLKCKLDREARRLDVAWADGFFCRYPWHVLRAHCPSATERAAREQASDPLGVLAEVPSYDIVDARLVGSYAINFTWGDGHSAGIYTWRYLRELADEDGVETTALA